MKTNKEELYLTKDEVFYRQNSSKGAISVELLIYVSGFKSTVVTEAKHLGSSLESYVQFVILIFFFFKERNTKIENIAKGKLQCKQHVI